MSRPIDALVTGVAPLSGGNFDKPTLKKYVVRMMRKAKSGIRRDEAKEILEFLLYAKALADEDPK
jgi:hypothetical protein